MSELKFMTDREIIDNIMEDLDEKAKECLRADKKEDLIKHHMYWGQHIRNEFDMWLTENPYCVHADSMHDDFPDQRSMRIIEGVWELLKITK